MKTFGNELEEVAGYVRHRMPELTPEQAKTATMHALEFAKDRRRKNRGRVFDCPSSEDTSGSDQ